jgi:hypothetical protein
MSSTKEHVDPLDPLEEVDRAVAFCSELLVGLLRETPERIDDLDPIHGAILKATDRERVLLVAERALGARKQPKAPKRKVPYPTTRDYGVPGSYR